MSERCKTSPARPDIRLPPHPASGAGNDSVFRPKAAERLSKTRIRSVASDPAFCPNAARPRPRRPAQCRAMGSCPDAAGTARSVPREPRRITPSRHGGRHARRHPFRWLRRAGPSLAVEGRPERPRAAMSQAPPGADAPAGSAAASAKRAVQAPPGRAWLPAPAPGAAARDAMDGGLRPSWPGAAQATSGTGERPYGVPVRKPMARCAQPAPIASPRGTPTRRVDRHRCAGSRAGPVGAGASSHPARRRARRAPAEGFCGEDHRLRRRRHAGSARRRRHAGRWPWAERRGRRPRPRCSASARRPGGSAPPAATALPGPRWTRPGSGPDFAASELDDPEIAP